MDILKLIRRDQRDLMNRFRQIELQPDSSQTIAELLHETLAQNRAIDKTLYRACRGEGPKLQRFAAKGHVRNRLIELALKRLSTLVPDPEQPHGEFTAIIGVTLELLTQQERRHKALLPRLKERLPKAMRRDLGEAYHRHKEALRRKEDGVIYDRSAGTTPESVPSGYVPVPDSSPEVSSAPVSEQLKPEPSKRPLFSRELRPAI